MHPSETDRAKALSRATDCRSCVESNEKLSRFSARSRDRFVSVSLTLMRLQVLVLQPFSAIFIRLLPDLSAKSEVYTPMYDADLEESL